MMTVNDNSNTEMIFPILGGALFLLLIAPWWLWLTVGAGLSISWWKRWRFKNLKAADQRNFFVNNEIFDRKPLMYLGTTQEGTIRWWYMRDGYGSYMVPQAIDNGQVYWDKKVQIKNPMLIVHLNGFAAMGNEWPEYYKTVMVPKAKRAQQNKSKKKKKQPKLMLTYQGQPVMSMDAIAAVPSNVPRADYAIGDADIQVDKYAKNAALASDAPMMNLINTVRELEEDATGKCPTIDFEGCAE